MKKSGYIIWTAAVIALSLILLGGCADGKENLSGAVYADSYEMDLHLDTEQKTLSGTADIHFTNRTDGELERVVVRNYPASILKELKKGSAEISAVTAEDGSPLSFSAGKDPSVVTVELGGQSLAPEESAVIKVTYKTDIPEVRDRFGVYREGKDEYYLLTFCFPMLSVFEDGKWNDSPYIFDGESTYSKVCDYKVRFEAPEDFLVAASGNETTTEAGVTEIKAENMRDMSIIASNNMEVQTDTAAGIRINNYTFRHPGYDWIDTYNELTMESAKESVEMFTELFGAYPYEELDVIQCADDGGMEYPGLILIGLPDVDPREGLMKGMENQGSGPTLCLLVAHETAHQWFYAAVGNDQYQEPWLDESFANYCENGIYGLAYPPALKRAIEIQEAASGQEVCLGWGSEEEVEEFLPKEPDKINQSYEAYKNNTDDYGWIVYEQGAQFLFELRKAMGDDRFFSMMREYYKTYCLKEAAGKDFVDLIHKYDDSKKVQRVIDRYIA